VVHGSRFIAGFQAIVAERT